jgi:hypothetical protein
MTDPVQRRCASILDGFVCPDDLCRNASMETLCGAQTEDYADDLEDDDLEDGT